MRSRLAARHRARACHEEATPGTRRPPRKARALTWRIRRRPAGPAPAARGRRWPSAACPAPLRCVDGQARCSARHAAAPAGTHRPVRGSREHAAGARGPRDAEAPTRIRRGRGAGLARQLPDPGRRRWPLSGGGWALAARGEKKGVRLLD